MRAWVMTGASRGGLQEISDPTVEDYDARVEMLSCGVCSSTDKMLRQGSFLGGVSFPSVLGHESVGRVVEIGAAVRNIAVGQLVTRPGAYSPERAPLAMYWGGFAEQGIVTDWAAREADFPGERWSARRSDQVVLDSETDPVTASTAISLAETFSVIARTDVVGKSIAVIGTGIAGLSLTWFARFLGARTVVAVGRRAPRLALARALGATATAIAGAEAEAVARDLGGYEVVFEASGDPEAAADAYRWLRRGGQEIVYSAPDRVAPVDLMRGPRDAVLTVASTHEASMLPSVLSLLERGVVDLDLLVTHRYAFSDLAEAFDEVERGNVVKAIIEFKRTD